MTYWKMQWRQKLHLQRLEANSEKDNFTLDEMNLFRMSGHISGPQKNTRECEDEFSNENVHLMMC
jgi:hypothetical protein